MKLTAKQEEFLANYIISRNASDAYRRAYGCKGWKEATVNNNAWMLVNNNSEIKRRITAIEAVATKKAGFGLAEIMEKLAAIITADPRELSAIRRFNCRYCNGIGGAWQWKDEAEWSRQLATAIDYNVKRKPSQAEVDLPSFAGGDGFKRKGPINPTCHHCEGDGLEDTYFADTNLANSPLFDGVKLTKNGIEVKQLSRESALDKMIRILGGYKDGAVPVVPIGGAEQQTAVPDDPIEAARFYKDFLGKS